MSSNSTESLADRSKSGRIAKLRIELKEWEHAFAKAHDGRKPTREETKKDTAITAKYKEYSKLRAASSSKINVLTHSNSTSSLKQRLIPQPSPQKNSTAPPIAQTPTKNTANSPWNDEIYESPLSARRQRIFGRRDHVGPTPQKTGRVLGIFDSFVDVESTPPQSGKNLGPGTPTKAGGDFISASPSSARKDDVSPFLTPRKRKLGDLKGRDPFATPSALRQWKPPPIEGEQESPQVRKPPPMPKRGLSSMLKELREMEDHALDDEEEAMREIEMEAAGSAALPPPSVAKKLETKKPVFDEVELPPLPPGAFVEETLVDEDEGKDVETPKIWKKKGLKRQHRRVIMRPVVAKPSAREAEKDGDGQSVPSDIADGEDPAADPDAYSGSDFEEYDDNGVPKPKRSKQAASENVAVAAKKEEKGIVEKGKEVVKKAVRRIAANAHSRMNFRKLNIKNKNSKGKGGGRFGGRGRRR